MLSTYVQLYKEPRVTTLSVQNSGKFKTNIVRIIAVHPVLVVKQEKVYYYLTISYIIKLVSYVYSKLNATIFVSK